MKKVFIAFGKQAKHAPKIQSRRLGHRDFVSSAYKSDGDKDDDDDSDVIIKSINDLGEKQKGQLEKIKSDLTGSIDKVKEDLSKDIQVVKDEQDKIKETVDALEKKAGRAALVGEQQKGNKSFEQVIGEALMEHSDDIAKIASKDSGRKKEFSIPLDMKAVGDMSTTNVTGSVWANVARPGIIMNPNRKVHMRDIIPGGNIGPGTEYVFMKENGEGEGAIAPVAEGATKPQIDLDLIEDSVKIETLAGWLRVTRKAMNNIPGFVSFLQARLPEKMRKVEDAQILNGDGVSPNLKGIQTAGNYTAATASQAIPKIEQLIQSIGQLESLDREATGIVLNTADYYSILTNTASGSGEYDLPQVVTLTSDGVLRILGIPIVHTTAQTADKYLVGDFRQGAQFLTQEGMRIEFFEQDGDNVRTNKVTVRIEETVALPVYGSTYFVYGDFTA